MVKFGKNKFKALNKIANKYNEGAVSNKLIKKKINAEKKVSFQKEVLVKELSTGSPLVKNVKAQEIILNGLSKKSVKRKHVKVTNEPPKRKQKSVEKHKKRQKTQISDTKLLLQLMKK